MSQATISTVSYQDAKFTMPDGWRKSGKTYIDTADHYIMPLTDRSNYMKTLIIKVDKKTHNIDQQWQYDGVRYVDTVKVSDGMVTWVGQSGRTCKQSLADLGISGIAGGDKSESKDAISERKDESSDEAGGPSDVFSRIKIRMLDEQQLSELGIKPGVRHGTEYKWSCIPLPVVEMDNKLRLFSWTEANGEPRSALITTDFNGNVRRFSVAMCKNISKAYLSKEDFGIIFEGIGRTGAIHQQKFSIFTFPLTWLNDSNAMFAGEKMLLSMRSHISMDASNIDSVLRHIANCKDPKRNELFANINKLAYALNTPSMEVVTALERDIGNKQTWDKNALNEVLAYLRITDRPRQRRLTESALSYLDSLIYDNPLEITDVKKKEAIRIFVNLSSDRHNRMNLNLTGDDWRKIRAKTEASLKALAADLDQAYDEMSKTNKDFKALLSIEGFVNMNRQDDKQVCPVASWFRGGQNQPNEQALQMWFDKYNLQKPRGGSCCQLYRGTLLKVGGKLNPPFQAEVEKVMGSECFVACRIKSGTRIMNKESEYQREEKPDPYGASIIDVVRCCCHFATPTDLVKGLQVVRSNFNVVRIKNTFHKDAPVEFGYRATYCSVLYESFGIKMICEIQLTLTRFKQTAKKMHVFYKVFRAGSAREVGYDMN